MTALKQILEENAKKYSRGTDSMDLPLYPIQWDIIQRGIKEWLQQKQFKTPNPDFNMIAEQVIEELLEELNQ